jgi:cytochrome c oxidase subunit 4
LDLFVAASLFGWEGGMNGRPSPIRDLWVQSGIVWLALSALAAVNLVLAYAPLGGLNAAANLAIALAMAILSALFFMGLRGDSGLVRLAAAGSLFWLLVLFALTFADYFTRRS